MLIGVNPGIEPGALPLLGDVSRALPSQLTLAEIT